MSLEKKRQKAKEETPGMAHASMKESASCCVSEGELRVALGSSSCWRRGGEGWWWWGGGDG